MSVSLYDANDYESLPNKSFVEKISSLEMSSEKFTHNYKHYVLYILKVLLSKIDNDDYDTNHQKWLDICTIIKNTYYEYVDNNKIAFETNNAITNIETLFFNILNMWSVRCPNYVESECELKWKNINQSKNGKSIASLFHLVNSIDMNEVKTVCKVVLFMIKYSKQITAEFNGENIYIYEIIFEERWCTIVGRGYYCPCELGCHFDGDGDKSKSSFKFTINSPSKDFPSKISIKCSHRSCKNKSVRLENLNIIDCKTLFSNARSSFDEPNKTKYEIVSDLNDKENELMGIMLQEPSHISVAKFLLSLNKTHYQSPGNKAWYMFNNQHWQKAKTEDINILISCLYSKMQSLYLNNSNKINTGKHNIMHKIKTLVSYLSNHNNRINIINHLCMDIYALDPLFESKLDTNNNLLLFSNGVIDLLNITIEYDNSKDICDLEYITNISEFRNGKQDDYLMNSIGYEFVPKPSKKRKEVMQFLFDILPNDDEREFVLLYIASSLSRENTNDNFLIFLGEKLNGKSALIDLLNLTLGSSFRICSKHILKSDISKRDLMEIKDKKLVAISDPGNLINSRLLKNLACKIPNKKNIDIKIDPLFKTIILCDDVPIVYNIGNAFWSRFVCIDFNTTFCENPTKSNEKLIDFNLNKKIKTWTNDFMIILLEYYIKYKQSNTITISNKMKAYCQDVKSGYISVSMFCDNCLTKLPKSGGVFVSELYKLYINKLNSNDNNDEVISLNNFIDIIKRKFVKYVTDITINNVEDLGIKNHILASKFNDDNSDNVSINNNDSDVNSDVDSDNNNNSDNNSNKNNSDVNSSVDSDITENDSDNYKSS